jgi:hypothetical protein
MRVIPIVEASTVVGGLTRTTKMPCPSYSLPVIACRTGARMAKQPGTVCSVCYAARGRYQANAARIEPLQVARLAALEDPDWCDAMVALVEPHRWFRWHDSGDLQGAWHLDLIVQVARRTPGTTHWLPTREPGMVAEWIRANGALPANLTVRLSATHPDRPTKVPASLRGHVAIGNVHTPGSEPAGDACPAPKQGGACHQCRACWDPARTVSYELH